MSVDDAFALVMEGAAFDAETWTPLPLRDASTDAAALPALLEWARAGGARFEAIELRVGADGNRTVHASRSIAAGEPLVSVPRALMITDEDVGAHPLIAAITDLEGTMLSPPCPLAVWLALELEVRTSPWRPFMAALPPTFAWMPLHRPAAQLAALTGTRALATIAYQARAFRADHAHLGQHIAGLASLPVAAHAWGHHVAESRVFRVRVGRRMTRALVPVADMFDHGRSDATWSYAVDDTRFEVRAARDLATGDEIQISYGVRGNGGYLATYGFALDDNHEDEAVVALPTPDGPRALTIGTHYDARFDQALAYARAATSDDDDAAGTAAAFAHLATAARATIAAIAAAPPADAADAAWWATCARVRAGEQMIATAVAELADEVAATGLDRPATAWQAIVDSVATAAGGVDRLRRELAQRSLDDAPSDGDPTPDD